MSSCDDIHSRPDFIAMASAVLQQDVWGIEDKLRLEEISERREVDFDCLIHLATGRALSLIELMGVPVNRLPEFIVESISTQLASAFVDGFMAGVGYQLFKDGRSDTHS